jgi:ssDNA-binding Zn-finger/Zn-ribbon topoisomerase 1
VYCGEKTTKHAPGEHKLWPSEPPVERPELPALEINADDRDEANKDLRMMAVSRRNLGNTLAALVCRERQLLECKAELLAALSRINQLEKDATEVVWIYECDKCAWIANPEHLGQRCRKCGGTCIRYATSAIGERQNVYFSNVYRREQLRAEKAESERDQLQLKLDAALAKTNTPEWFDTPCARAVREVVGDK